MGSRITVNLTQSDIDKALKNHSSRCVVATAIKRAVPNAKRVEVDMQTIRWSAEDEEGNNERVVYVTPMSVMDYIVAFDAGDELLPFNFYLFADRKATIPAIKRNTAARQVDTATKRVKNSTARAAKTASDPKATKAAKKVAAEKVTQAKEELAEVKATVGPLAERTKVKGNATHWRIPRHSKTGRRYFGAKVMRVNEDRFGLTPSKPGGKAKS